LENQPKQKELYKKVLNAINNCDVFIFQHHSGDRNIQELTTQYLAEYNNSCLSICLPSFWYTGYLNTSTSTNPVLHKLYSEYKYDAKMILNFLRSHTDNFVNDMIDNEHNKSIIELNKRHAKESQIYHHFIGCVDFISDNYDKKIIAYTHSHPSVHYYNYIIDQLNQYDLQIEHYFDYNSLMPGANDTIRYSDLYYFKQYFSLINDDLYKHNHYFTNTLTLSTVCSQINKLWPNKTKGNA
jgi:hypothetical protein